VSLIGQSVGSTRLLMLLVVGAVFWNYLSVVFQSIGDTITWERWEGTLEYTMMAPVRRSVQLLGSALYAVIYGLIHTTILLIILALFSRWIWVGRTFRQRRYSWSSARPASSASVCWQRSCR